MLSMGIRSVSISAAIRIRKRGRKISPSAVTIFESSVPVTVMARKTLISTRTEAASI